MKQTCSRCQASIEINEKDYKPGEKVEMKCRKCDNLVTFLIPEEKPKIVEKIVIRETESLESQQKIAELESRVRELSRRESGTFTPPAPPIIPPTRDPLGGEEGGNRDHARREHRGVLPLLGFLVLLCIGGGIFYYKSIYLPEKRDREAPRYYTFADAVVLRSSQSAGADFNKIGSLPYGTELITYDYKPDWSSVKVSKGSTGSKELKGYVASPFILNKADFYLLNSIWGDTDSKEVVSSSKCRRALLNYYKENHLMGELSEEMRTEAGITLLPTQNNQWQVFCGPVNSKYNNAYYKRLINSSSKYTDFAIIIKNIHTSERKFLFFSFDDDETPRLLLEKRAPDTGFIKSVSVYSDGYKRYLNDEYTY